MTEARNISICTLIAATAWLVSVLILADAWITHPDHQQLELLTATAVIAACVAVVFQVRSYLVKVSRLVRLTQR